MFYYKGWTTEAYEETCKDRKSYRVIRDFMLVPEILLTPEINLYYSRKHGLAWVEGSGVQNDQIAPLTNEQFDQMCKEGIFALTDVDDEYGYETDV